MQLLYRPDREPIPRSGGRYWYEYRLAPGLNQLSEDAAKYFSEYLLTDEGKELLKTTVLEEVKEQPKKESKPVSKTGYQVDGIPVINAEEEPEDEPMKPRRRPKNG